MAIRFDQGMVHGPRWIPPHFFFLYWSLLFKLPFKKEKDSVVVIWKYLLKSFGGFSGLIPGLECANTGIISAIFRQEEWTHLPQYHRLGMFS